MFQLDVMSRTPVYEQIIMQFERFVMMDLLKPGDRLDSVRGLSVQLSINPNTIQKAYSELDIKGLIYSVPGKGCFVTADAKEKIAASHRSKVTELTALLEQLKLAGVTKSEIKECVDQVYSGEVIQ